MTESLATTMPTMVERARTGEALAWRELYDAHAGRLVLWLSQTPTGDAGVDADDLAMEAWALAASRIADFAGSDDDFAGWLFTIARNHLMNTRRRSARRATYATGETPEPPIREDTAHAPVETTEAIRLALRALPPREGEAVALLDVVGVEVTEAARILGVRISALRMARRRGLARLRRAGWAV